MTIGTALMMFASMIVHPMAVSLAEIEYNATTESLEVALRCYPEALDRAIKKFRRETKEVSEDSSEQEWMTAYLEANVRLWEAPPPGARSTPMPKVRYRWVGQEEERGAVWLFFEIPWKGSMDRLMVRSTIPFDIFPEQLNTVIISKGDREATCSLHRRQPEQRAEWKRIEPGKKPARPRLEF